MKLRLEARGPGVTQVVREHKFSLQRLQEGYASGEADYLNASCYEQ